MQHLWSAATWELQENEDSSEESTIGVPVTIVPLDILEGHIVSELHGPVYEVPLARDMYLLTAWYVHDFLDNMSLRSALAMMTVVDPKQDPLGPC